MWWIDGFILLATVTGLAVRFCLVFPRISRPRPLLDLNASGRETALRLEQHVRAIASVEHNVAHPAALEAAAAYIERELIGYGLTPRRQTYKISDVLVFNIDVAIGGRAQDVASDAILVVGAHYDSAEGTPGANDNGSGVAALLELAKRFAHAEPHTGLRLVFFVNEEHPYAKTPDMGSYRYAEALSREGQEVVGMIALETLGYFSQRRGSQRFPFPFNWLYPDVGNFVAFVGTLRARTWVHRCVRTFRRGSTFPCSGAVGPGFVEGIDFSDHWAFGQFGYAACMVTDTAPFRNPFYHTPYDTPDTVDYANLARVTDGLEAAIRDILGLPPPIGQDRGGALAKTPPGQGELTPVVLG